MSITYLEAIREAQAKALRDDPSVFIYGQDIATFGGAFKATKNLARDFPGRVLDSPISEDAMVGMAVGAPLGGIEFGLWGYNSSLAALAVYALVVLQPASLLALFVRSVDTWHKELHP